MASRVLETVQYPTTRSLVFLPPPGMPIGVIDFDTNGYLGGNNYPSPSSVFFPQPRLGRKWIIDRFVIANYRLFQYGGDYSPAGPRLFAFTFSVELNNVPMGQPVNVIYQIQQQIPLPSAPVDIGKQNGPAIFTPYNAVEVFSGDQLKAILEWNVNDNTSNAEIKLFVSTTMQVVGTDERA